MKKKAPIVIVITVTVIALCLLGFLFFRKGKKEETRVLRVLVTASDFENDALHRVEMPIDRERALLQSFAVDNQLKIEYVPVPSFHELFLWLDEGKGDLISANLAETKLRKEEFLLSLPFEYTREIVFTSTRNQRKGSLGDLLAGKIGQLLPNTTYVANFSRFAEGFPKVRYRILPATLSHDRLIEYVQQGRIDYSVLNECDLDAWLSCNSGIIKLFPVRDRVPLVFAARKNSQKLIEKLNDFLSKLEIQPPAIPKTVAEPVIVKKASAPKVAAAPVLVPEPPRKKIYTFDLNRIKKRGYIRMLTVNDAFCCYLKKGQLCGIEYELGKRFADSLGVKLMTVIPPGFFDLFRYLEEGKGDFIAANLTLMPERLRDFPNLAFSSPYHGATEMVAGRINEKIRSISDLAGRKIYVTQGNSYYWTLKKLQKEGAKFTIVPIPEGETALIVLHKVISGEYDLTVIDDNYLNFAIAGGFKIKKLMPLSAKRPFGWVVRKSDPKLTAAVRKFFKKENKSTFFNLCVKRTYNLSTAKLMIPKVTKNAQLVISPYDAIFRKYGTRYDFNWLTLAAQSYQESRFRADLVNEIGAAGMMQVMPRTAKELGVSNLKNPENGIYAGTKYLAKLRARFPEQISAIDRHCLALASYNAGYGHVRDARLLAERIGLNPNIWFNHTEKALALLENPRYAAKAKCGYCRASETIPYVRNILLQSKHYQELLKSFQEKKKSLNSKHTKSSRK